LLVKNTAHRDSFLCWFLIFHRKADAPFLFNQIFFPQQKLIIWFNRAVKAQVDYMGAYKRLAWALRPRWCGSLEAMYALGVKCLETGRYDTKIPFFYYEVIKDIAEELDSWNEIYKDPAVCENMRLMLEKYIARAGDEDKNYYRSILAYFAYRKHDYDMARKLMDELADKLQTRVFEKYANPNMVIGNVYAYTGPLAEELKKADTLIEKGEWGEAKKTIQTCLEKENSDFMVKQYLERRIDSIDIYLRYQSTEWQPFLPEKGQQGWHLSGGLWDFHSQTSVTGKTDSNGSMAFWCGADVPKQFQMKGRFDLDTHYRHIDFRIKFPFLRCAALTLCRKKQKIFFGGYYNKKDRIEKEAPVRGINRFFLQVYGSRIDFVLNGEHLLNNVDLNRFPEYYPQSNYNTGIVVFTGGDKKDVRTDFQDFYFRKCAQPPSVHDLNAALEETKPEPPKNLVAAPEFEEKPVDMEGELRKEFIMNKVFPAVLAVLVLFLFVNARRRKNK
jgi:hypothetical protein